MSFWELLFSKSKVKTRLYVDACHFDPEQQKKNEAWILFTHNEGEGIYKQVSDALSFAGSVIVIDQASSDGTAFLAAQAGAVVIIQEEGQSGEAALHKAVRLAHRMARNVRICD